jgi:hypothetical protein
MPSLAALGRRELVHRLRGGGLRLQTGPFLTNIRSPLDALADQLLAMYGDYGVEDGAGVADFHVRLAASGGLRRWVRPQVIFHYDGLEPFEPLPLAQTFPMLEWGLNWCVTSHAQSWLVIHAAVVEKDGGAVILPAPSGSGKSTLCAALVSRGWRLLSDELTLVRLQDGRIEPNPRPVSLKNQSIDIMRAYAPEQAYSAPVRDTVKGTVAHMRVPADSVARAGEPADPAFVIFPRYQAGAAPSLRQVAPARAFFRLAENAFNYSALGRTGFDCVAALTGATRAFDFSYASLDEAVAVFERLMAQRP